MYHGFSREQAEAYEKEARERWGEAIVEESKQRLKQMGKAGLDALKKEGEDINRELSALMHLPPGDEQVQDLVKRHYNMTGRYYTVTPEIYLGLGDMYVDDGRFREHYDKYKEGLAAFLRDAIQIWLKNRTFGIL